MEPELIVASVEQAIQTKIARYTSDPSRWIAAASSSMTWHIPPRRDSTSDLGATYLIVMAPGGRSGAVSTKPSNLLINWRKLALTGPQVALSAQTATTIPLWGLPLVGLLMFSNLRRLTRIRIDEEHAAVIWALWKLKEEHGEPIPRRGLPGLINTLLEPELGRRLQPSRLYRVLKRLDDFGCIRMLQHTITLVEEMRIQF